MKSFRKIVSEVAEPKAGDEKHFKDKHIVTKIGHPVALDHQFTGEIKGIGKATRVADYEKGEDEKVYEAMDPVNKKAALGKFKDRADKDIDNDGDVDSSDKYIHARRKAITKAIHKEEAEELDELSKKTLGSYVKKATGDAVTKAYRAGDVRDKDSGKNYMKALGRQIGISKATSKLTKEEVEQLDELSPNTLHSYIKKAAGNMAGNAAVAAAQASSSMKKSSPDVKRKIKNRMRGITGASGRLSDKANMAENWQEEIPMMIRQLEFIAYAAEEIMDYVETAGDPEEWFQNKISGVHQSMLSMYAYAQGGRRAGYGFDESVEEELKGGQKKLDHNKNGKIDAHDFKLMRSKKMKEDLDEAKDDVDAKWLVTWKKEQSAGKYIDASAFFPTEREARMYKGRLKYTSGVLRNSPEMKKIKQTEADKRALAKESFELDEAVNVKGIQKAIDDGKSMDVIMTMFANKRTTNTDEIRKVVQDYKWKKRMKKEEVSEAAPKMKPDFLKTQREKDRAHDAAMGRTPTGRKKPMTSTQRSIASMRKEESDLDEATPAKKAITRALQGMKVQPKDKVTVKKAPWEKNEEVDLDESIVKMPHGRLKFHLNTNTPHGSYSNDEMKSERDRRLKTGEGEAYRKAKAGLSEVTQTAMKKTVTYIDPKGHSRTRDVPVKRIDRDEHGQDKIRESVEMLDEAFKVGMVKLKDGGSVVLKKEDADLLNKMFKDLSSTNRKKMQEVAMKDKSGFEEILGFAREAL